MECPPPSPESLPAAQETSEQPHPETVEIAVKDVSAGKSLRLMVERSMTVAELKDRVELMAGIPASRVRLFFGGRRLQDTTTVSEAEIEPGSILVAMMPLRCSCPQPFRRFLEGGNEHQKGKRIVYECHRFRHEDPDGLHRLVFTSRKFGSVIFGKELFPCTIKEDGRVKLHWLWVEFCFPLQYPFEPLCFRALNVRGNSKLGSDRGQSIQDGHPLVTDYGGVFTSKTYKHQWHPAFQMRDVMADIEGTLRDPNHAVGTFKEREASGTCLGTNWFKDMPDYATADWDVKNRKKMLKSKLTDLQATKLLNPTLDKKMNAVEAPIGSYKIFGLDDGALIKRVTSTCNIKIPYDKRLVETLRRDISCLRMLHGQILMMIDVSKCVAAEQASKAFDEWSRLAIEMKQALTLRWPRWDVDTSARGFFATGR